MKRKLVYLMTYERIVQHDASAGCSTLCPLFCWSDFICFACLLVCLSLTAFKGGTHAFEDDAHASPGCPGYLSSERLMALCMSAP